MNKDLAVAMGKAARQARDARRLTQEQVAEMLGVSIDFYSRIERGRAHPSLDTFLRMLSVLDVSADALLGLESAGGIPPAAAPLLVPEDPPAVRRLISELRQARPGTLRLVSALLKEFERTTASGGRAGEHREQPAGED